MWEKFSNLFSGFGEDTPSNSFGIQQSYTSTPDWFWGSNQPTQGFGMQQAITPVREFGIAQSYNAMNSPRGSLASGAPWDNSLYKKESPGWFSTDGAAVALQGLRVLS